METDISTALATLQIDPDTTQALGALKRIRPANGSGVDPDALGRALTDARRWHRERGDFDLCVQLIDLELPWITDPARRANLLHEKGRLLADELLSEEAAQSALREALKNVSDHAPSVEGLAQMALIQSNWQPIASRYLQQAEGAPDKTLASSLFGSVAEMYIKYRPDAPEGETYLRRSLELDPKNRRSSAHLERLLRKRGRSDELLALLSSRASQAQTRDERALAEVAQAELSLKLGNQEEALGHFRKALEANPSEAKALRHLGQGALVARLRLRRARRQQRQQLVRAAALAQQPFEGGARAAVLGIQLQAAPQVRLALGRIGPILDVHLGHGAEQAGGERLVRRRLGLLQIARSDRLPVRLDQRHLRQPLGGGGVLGHALQRLAQGCLRRLFRQQFVREQTTFFMQQIRPARGVGEPGQLEIDQLHAQLEVTAFAVPTPCVRQGATEGLGGDPTSVRGTNPFQRPQGLGVVRIDLQRGKGGRNVGFHWALDLAGEYSPQRSKCSREPERVFHRTSAGEIDGTIGRPSASVDGVVDTPAVPAPAPRSSVAQS